MSAKTSRGKFFEDFQIGQTIRHATPRTVTLGDVALYNGLFGARFAVQSSDAFAQKVGYPRSPLDDLLVFHIVFGKTVADICLNAVANLGYADCRYLKPVFPGTTLTPASDVIGLRENSNKKTGIVYVRSRGFDESGSAVLDLVRWVMVRKRDEAAATPAEEIPVERVPDEPPPAAQSAAVAAQPVVVPPDYSAAYLNNPGPQYPYAARRRREAAVPGSPLGPGRDRRRHLGQRGAAAGRGRPRHQVGVGRRGAEGRQGDAGDRAHGDAELGGLHEAAHDLGDSA